MSETEDFYTSGTNKRMASEEIDIDGNHKRPRQGQHNIEVRFLLQSKNAGAIIGKSGSNINRLRQDFKASVTVPDCPGPERILSIGIEADSLQDILMDIIPKLEEYNNDNKESKYEMRMLLHQGHAGCIIGKGGSQIKALRDKTAAHIKVYSSCCPSSTERVVQVSGDLDVVVNCITEIINLVNQAAVKGQSILYDPHNYDSFYANDYGGHSDGSRGNGQMGGRWAPFPSRGGGGGGGGGGPMRGASGPMRIPPPPFISGGGRSPPSSRHSGFPPPGVRSWTPTSRPSLESRGVNWRNNSIRDNQYSGMSQGSGGSGYRSSNRNSSYQFSPRFPFSKPSSDNYNFNSLGSPPSASSAMGDSGYGQQAQNYGPDSSPGSLFNSKTVINGDKQSGTSQVTIPNEVNYFSNY